MKIVLSQYEINVNGQRHTEQRIRTEERTVYRTLSSFQMTRE